MRLLIKLTHRYRTLQLPIDMNTFLLGYIYHTLEKGSPTFSAELHQSGEFKHFTFSMLQSLDPNHRWVLDKERGSIRTTSRQIGFYISSPNEEFITTLITGFLSHSKMELAGVFFGLDTVQVIDPPVFQERMSFTMLSPLFLSERLNGAKHQTHLTPESANFEQALLLSLIRKYESLLNRPFLKVNSDTKTSLRFVLPEKRPKSIVRLVTLKTEHAAPIHNRCTFTPFELHAPTELIQIGYESGFGVKCSQGFGMVAVKGSSE
ncbi:MAG: CRISPR-associated endoribonuclease Cas6 [Chloroherpetonaceae bacterium]|nr:CRISPR-associated endoribonuclease Cas6 [Chloroherpetonaceae bacterium]